MAETVVFADGSHAILFSDPDDTKHRGPELLQMLRDKLGEEAASAVEHWQTDLEKDKKITESERRDFEMSCDAYRAALQDAWDCLEETLVMLDSPRIARVEVQKKLRECVKNIKSLL